MPEPNRADPSLPLEPPQADRPLAVGRQRYEPPAFEVDGIFETLALTCIKKHGSKSNFS